MKKSLVFIFFIISFYSCGDISNPNSLKVNNNEELNEAILSAKPGDQIVMANGVWKDVQIKFSGKGTKDKSIVLRAETASQVTIEGASFLKLGGEYLEVKGLYFKNGYTPSNTIIEFKIDDENVANNCRVTNCVIEGFTQPVRDKRDHWIEFWGRNNQLDHCYISGKSNSGPTLRVYLRGNEHIKNYHQITNNYFGPRPRKGGPHAETMQIGTSSTSMAPSHVMVADNLFERCNGEVEVISSKSNFNEFRNNIFYECEGSLVLRHGNYCTIDGNVFIGNDNSEFIGGIRVINTGHWITNNYFYKLKASEFRAPLAVMNGIPKSPLNRYKQVTDAVIAYNTWVDCKSPWHFSVGTNIDKSDVLPPQEIRSARPVRTLLANNIIYNHEVDKNPIRAYDKVDGITLMNNIIDNQNGEFDSYEGLDAQKLEMEKFNDWLYFPSENKNEILENTYSGFEFESIENDLFDSKRKNKNRVGAITSPVQKDKLIIDKNQFGPSWFSSKKTKRTPKIISVSANGEDLYNKIIDAEDGDIIELDGNTTSFNKSLIIDKKITIKAKDEKAKLIFTGPENTPAFQMHPNGNLTLENINLSGESKQLAFAPLIENMSSAYNLWINNCQINDFDSVLKGYKGSFADSIYFSNTTIKNCANGIELASETDDKGEYNAEFVSFINCEFDKVQKNVINFYRGGYDESTIGGVLDVNNCTFTNCGNKEQSGILIKTRGIINVNISKNTFRDNPVKLIASLWGEKNNKHQENTSSNSGKIVVEEFLKQKLMY